MRARRFVRERGASERGLAPAAWEDGGSAVLQVGTPVVMLMAGLQIARRLFAGPWVRYPRGGGAAGGRVVGAPRALVRLGGDSRLCAGRGYTSQLTLAVRRTLKLAGRQGATLGKRLGRAALLRNQANVGRQPLGGSATGTPPGGMPCGPVAAVARKPLNCRGCGVPGESVALGTVTPAS